MKVVRTLTYAATLWLAALPVSVADNPPPNQQAAPPPSQQDAEAACEQILNAEKKKQKEGLENDDLEKELAKAEREKRIPAAAVPQIKEQIEINRKVQDADLKAAEDALVEAKRATHPDMKKFFLNVATEKVKAAHAYGERVERDTAAITGKPLRSQPSPIRPSTPITVNSETLRQLERMVQGGEPARRIGYENRLPRGEAPNIGTGTRVFQGGVREPGGIKFNGERADTLALTLDLTGIDYDPARGQVVLVGSKSSEVFEMDVFADILQLAIEEHEPFFSLDPSNAGDWDSSGTREFELLVRHFRSADDIARRIRTINPKPIEHGGRQYYYATVEQLVGPDLIAEVHRGRDISSKLVFSPAWLRHTKLGWMLFEADLAIKAVASGFLNRGSKVVPAPSWRIPGFDPQWIHRDPGNAGRANFELDDKVRLPRSGTRLDLSEIRPKLDVVERKAGTSIDLDRSPRCRAISDHFRDHWRDYVREVPEIARLMMIYRAYVAARFLAKEHPGLAARIQEMPRFVGVEDKVPLRIIEPHVVRVAFENGQLVSLVPGKEIYVDLGGGYGGGTAFRYRDKVSPQTVAAVAPDDWVRAATRTAPAAGSGWMQRGNQVAAVLELVTNELSGAAMRALLAAIALLAVTATVGGLFARQFDWQRISDSQTCPHCGRVHTRLGSLALVGDGLAATALYFIAVLPLALAAQDAGLNAAQLAIALTLLVGLTAALFLAGRVTLVLIARARRSTLVPTGFLPSVFCGARIAIIALAVALLHRGWSSEAVGERIVALISPELGERMLAMLGGPAPITLAVSAGAFGALLAVLTRWLAPFLFDSRPLALLSSAIHSHQKLRTANP